MVVSLLSFHEVNDNDIAGESAGKDEVMADIARPENL
jgi:hypothetical protein